MKFILFSLLIISFSGPGLAQKLILLHTNDHHGHFMTSETGEFGLAAQATLVKQVREEAKKTGAHVLIVSAGDINSGPPESNLFKAKPDIEAMNTIGYRAMAVGNHEFDNPLSTIREQQKIAKFDFLSANIFDQDGKHAFTPYITTEVDGKKIAIIGFTTPDTPKMTPKAHTAGLKFLDPAEAAKDLVKKLRKENDMIIALSHLGYFANGHYGNNAPGDVTLAKRLPEIDVIVGGHTHTELNAPVRVGETYILQAKESSRFVGRMDLNLSSGKPVLEKYQLIPIKNIPHDKEIVKLIQPYLDEGNKRFSKIVGTAMPGFAGNRGDIIKNEVPMGHFASEAQRVALKADLVLNNAAGLRNGIDPGEISIRDLLNVSPFGNPMTMAEFNGKEVWKFVETAIQKFKVPGNFPYFSNNLTIEMDGDKISKILLDGKEVPNTLEGKYKVAANNFVSEMVDEFAFMKEHPTYHHTGIKDAEAYQIYLDKKKVITPEEFSHKTFVTPNCVRNALRSKLVK